MIVSSELSLPERRGKHTVTTMAASIIADRQMCRVRKVLPQPLHRRALYMYRSTSSPIMINAAAAMMGSLIILLCDYCRLSASSLLRSGLAYMESII